MSARKRKLQLTLDENAYNTLSRLGEDSNASSLAEVIRNAIALFDWARAQEQEGFKVGAFKEGAPAKEVVLPFARPRRA
jgi:hypothetical protein